MSQSTHATEIAIVGGGIIGLTLAYTLAKVGHKVSLFEKNERAVGATIRNFGMIWPIGQPSGKLLNRAMRSRSIWEEVAKKAGIWHDPVGSLHLAYREDEWRVLEEFCSDSQDRGYSCELLNPEQVLQLSPAANPTKLLGGLLSHTEMIVDPREVPGALTEWLKEMYQVEFHYHSSVLAVEEGKITTSKGVWAFDKAYVCCGAELEMLFPKVFLDSEITKVKLQMLRSTPQAKGWRMGPSICGGLTLTHYHSFSHCTTLQTLKDRIQAESPWFPEWGIHVMMSQNGKGELVIGDSHEYGWVHDPFLREEVNQFILTYLRQLIQVPQLEIAERWYGIYSKMPTQSELLFHPFPSVTVLTGVGGAGMTQSFGLAEEVVRESL